MPCPYRRDGDKGKEPMERGEEPVGSRSDRLAELALAAGVVVFGALVVWQTTEIRVTPAYALVGPRVVPYIVGFGLVVVGLWLAAEVLTGRGAAPSAESEDADP